MPALAASLAQAAFPGRPGPIVYSKTSTDEVGEGTVERLGGLFVRDPRRGRQPRQLTSDPGDHSPSYSPDGRRLVFAGEDEAGGSAVYLMAADGSGGRQLVTADGAEPAFLAADGPIAFVRSVDGHSHIFTVRLDGSGLGQVTFGAHDDRSPAVSPRGGTIAFVSDRDPDGRRDRSDIFTVRPDGTRLRVLIDGPRSEYDPDYAPSGRRIAFASGRGRGIGVFVAAASGRHVERLTPCNPFPSRCRTYVEPAFSPDGRQIAVLGLGTRSSTISVIGSDGGFAATIDSGSTEEEGFGSHVGAPTWAPG
jgi:Tol biopolymer transport system component